VWQSISERRRWALVVLAAALALAVLNVWWVATYRRGYPFDVDEAGYTTYALVNYLALKAGGLHAWWDAVLNMAPNAPLLPALTSLVFVFKGGVLEGFGVLTAFLVLLTLAVYGIGERLTGPKLGALAALVAATSPGAFFFSREYVFALPAAALLACAVYFLLRTDGLKVSRWAIACGAALGLMLLARTMTIAFVPGVLAAAVVCLVARRQGDLVKRLLNLGLLTLTGAAVAATWYARNLHAVYDYLTSYGYGAQSKYFGTSNSLLSWDRLRSTFVHMVEEDLLLPLAVLMTLGLVTVVVVVVRRVLRASDRPATLRRLARSDALSVAIVVAAGYAALNSSQNAGEGFALPIAILIPALAVVALRLVPAAVVPAVVVVGLVASFNVLANQNISPTMSRTRQVSVPGLGSIPYTSGVPHAVGAIRAQVPGPEARFDDRDRGWLRADQAVARQALEWSAPDGTLPVVAFASRNRAISTNSAQLASVLTYHLSIPFVQLNAEPDDSVANYARQLTDPEFGHPAVLITMSRNTGDFPPLVTQSLVETAALRVGFRMVRTMRLPDGRQLRFWRRQPPGLRPGLN
jgi:4-amino-4-deoxy-L-arabinose transferase-like glycosyltransferase